MPPAIHSVRSLLDHGFPFTAHADLLPALAGVTDDEAFPGLVGRLRDIRSVEELAAELIEAKHSSLGGDAGVLGPPLGRPNGTMAISPALRSPSFDVAPQPKAITSPSRARRVGSLRNSLGDRVVADTDMLSVGHLIGGQTVETLSDPRPVPNSINVQPVGDGVGFNKHYRNGSIYWTPAEGTHHILGQVLFHWFMRGATNGILGYPSTDALATPGGDGNYNHFTGGTVLWTVSGGVHHLHGAIEHKWIETGDVDGPLGLPVSDVAFAVGGERIGFFARFQGGSIYSSAATGTHAVYGAVEKAWSAAGGIDGGFGWPVTSVGQEASGSPSLFGDFEDGVLYWPYGASNAVTVFPTNSHANVTLKWSFQELETALLPGLQAMVAGLNGASVIGGLERSDTEDMDFDGLVSHNRRHHFRGVVRLQWGDNARPVLSGTLLAAAAVESRPRQPNTIAGTTISFRSGRFASTSSRRSSLGGFGVDHSRPEVVVDDRITNSGVELDIARDASVSPSVDLDFTAVFSAPEVDARWDIEWVIQVSWDPSQHSVVAAVVDYALGGASQSGSDAKAFALAQLQLEQYLDSRLWNSWVLNLVPLHPADDPRAVLSVKVATDGHVRTYLAPDGQLPMVAIGPDLLRNTGFRGVALGDHVLGRGVTGLRIPATVLLPGVADAEESGSGTRGASRSRRPRRPLRSRRPRRTRPSRRPRRRGPDNKESL